MGKAAIARYLLQRFIQSLGVLLGLIVAVFFVTRLIGDPVRLMLHPNASDEQIRTVREQFGLNDSLVVQFGRYLANLARGDFGDSMWQRAPALEIVVDRLPATIYLAAVTMLIAIPIAVVLGAVSAVWPGSLADRVVTVVALAGVSIADFWLALMAILLFAVEFGWLPTSGFGGPRYVLLPALVLAVRPFGRISQIQRGAMLDELAKGYVTSARAKGLSERAVILSHTFKNAAIPSLTMAGHETTSLLNGAIVIETVFGWPGLGGLLIQAIGHRDLPLVVAATVVIAVMVMAVNLLIDLLYALVDPRIRYG